MSDRQDDDIEDEIIIEQEGDESESEPEEKVSKAEADDSDEGELESYSKGVQKRISRLTEKYRKEERDRQEAVRLAQQLLQEKQQLEGRLKQLDSGYLNEYGARIEAQVTAARRAYKDAYEAGDTDKMIEAQEALARATTDKQRYDLAKSRADERVQTTAAPPQQQYAAPQQQAVAQQPQVDPKAQSWAEKNDWFGQDEVMTYAAFGVHRKLVEEEGFDPQSDEYYSEIDRRMRTEFPHKFQASKSSGEKSGRTRWLFSIPQHKTGAQDREAITVADRHCEKAERSSRGIRKVRKGLI
jgi:hypothetical protein